MAAHRDGAASAVIQWVLFAWLDKLLHRLIEAAPPVPEAERSPHLCALQSSVYHPSWRAGTQLLTGFRPDHQTSAILGTYDLYCLTIGSVVFVSMTIDSYLGKCAGAGAVTHLVQCLIGSSLNKHSPPPPAIGGGFSF